MSYQRFKEIEELLIDRCLTLDQAIQYGYVKKTEKKKFEKWDRDTRQASR